MSEGGGSGAPPSATSVGGGSGAPPSARIVAFSEQFPEVAGPQAEPNTSTNPRHTNRILPKCIVSSSEVHGVRKNLTPSAKHAWRLRPASVFALEKRKSARLSNQQVPLPSNREVSRLMTTDERMRDLPVQPAILCVYFTWRWSADADARSTHHWLQSQAVCFFADFDRRRLALCKKPGTCHNVFKLLHDPDHVRLLCEAIRVG